MRTDFAVWCESCNHDHQAREHSVPCSRCGYSTTAVHGVCYGCQETRYAEAVRIGVKPPKAMA